MNSTNAVKATQIPHLLLLIFFVTILISNHLFAQQVSWQDKLWSPELRVQNWTTKDGLPQNSVNAIIKSSQGYLYVGTFGGLCRFDGVRFEVVSHPKLAYQRIVCLFESDDSTLWIGTETNGLLSYKEGKVKHYNKNNGLPGNGVNSVFQLSDGTIVALVHNIGLAYIKNDSVDYSFDPVLSESNLLQGAVSAPNDVIWISTSKGVFKLSEKNAPLQYVEGSKHRTHGRPINVSKKGDIYFANETGIFKVNKSTMEAELIYTLNTSVSTQNIIITDKEEFWIGLNLEGIKKVSATEELESITASQLPKGSVNAIYAEDDEAIWVGLNGGGLAKLNKNMVSVIKDSVAPIATEIALAVHQDFQQNIWFGTNGKNLYKIDYQTGTLRKVGDEMSPPQESVWSIASDQKGNVWLATFGYGLFHGNQLTGKKFEWVEDWGAKSHIIVAIFYDEGSDRLLVGTHRGGVFQYQNNEWSNLIAERVLESRVLQFAKGPDERIYIATLGDGIKILQKDTITMLTTEDGLSSNSIRSMYFDEDDNLWIGTYGSGLNLILSGQKKVYVIDKKDGLYDNLVSSIQEDKYGYFWLSCNVGVFRVSRQSLLDQCNGLKTPLICQVFNESHGMGDAETNGGFQSSSLQLENGLLLYPTVKGVSVFNPEAIISNNQIDKVVIERVSYGDTTVTNYGHDISISPEYRDIEIEFSAPFYTAPELIKFEYKLAGYDDDWRTGGVQRSINYTRLAPGTYTFFVRAVDGLGVPSLTTASVQIEIQSFWYELFIVQFIAVVILLGGTIFLVVRTQNQSLKRTINEQKIALAKKQIIGLEKDVAKSERELTTYTLEVIEKNNLLRELSENLSAAQSEQDFARVKRELNIGIKSTKDWEEFKIRFEKVDADFIKRLNNQYPSLTKGQVRLASLIRLGFTSKQIADFLNNSPGSVDVARSKLRKKLGISREEDLTDFLSNI
jgi:ligand-binding sensor domain-containing protein/DNA-binding CsgD family transcriptional regulator